MTDHATNPPQRQVKRLADLVATARAGGLAPRAVRVLSDDPYFFDTAANHRDGAWLGEEFDRIRPEGRIHVRGLHYALLGRRKPDGSTYVNDERNWIWLSETAAPAARWLGYIAFARVQDNRNSPPAIHFAPRVAPEWKLQAGGLEVGLPAADELVPQFRLAGSIVLQPTQQVVIAEKSGVADLLLPICKQFRADLALPTGEASTTMVYEILERAAADGRPLVVHQLGDADPAGHQMAVSTARKLQAIRDQLFPDLAVSLYPIGLTVDQAKAWGLPSTPLKDTESRADRWMAAMGHAQTELDAAVILAPGPFSEVVEMALAANHDPTVDIRAQAERRRLEAEANANLQDTLGADVLDRIHAAAMTAMDRVRAEIDALNATLTVDMDEVGLTRPETPDVIIGTGRPERGGLPPALLDTADGFAANSVRLLARKTY